MKREDIITQLMEQGLSRIEAEMQLAHFNVHNDTAQAMYEACNCEAI